MKICQTKQIVFSIIGFFSLFVFTQNVQAQGCSYIDFDYTISSDGCMVTFDAYTVGNITNISWDFGDGALSFEESPTHTFAGSDCYIVTLNADLDGNSASQAKQICLTSCGGNSQGPSGSIDGPVSGNTNSNYTYSINVYGGVPPYSYDWDAGGGDVVGSSDAEPTFVVSFPFTGNYEIECEVTDGDGNITVHYLDVLILDSSIDFTWGPAVVDIPVSFIGQYDTWDTFFDFQEQWSYDNEPYTSSPSHTFTTTGTHPVTMKLVNPWSGVEYSITKYVEVFNTFSEAVGVIDVNIEMRISTPNYHNNNCYPHTHTYEPNIINSGESVSIGLDLGLTGCPEDPATGFPLAIPQVLDQYTSWPPYVNTQYLMSYYGLVKIEFINQGLNKSYYYYPSPILHPDGSGAIDFGNATPYFPTYYLDDWDEEFYDWGCWDIWVGAKAKEGGTTHNSNNYFECVVYVEPDEMIISNIEVTDCENNCDEYILKPTISGGAYKYPDLLFGEGCPECTGNEQSYELYNWQGYDEYEWQIFSLIGEEQDLTDVGFLQEIGEGHCVKIDTHHEYFDNFIANNITPQFLAVITVTDYMGASKTYNKVIEVPMPIKIDFPTEMGRCEGTSPINLSGHPIAYGGDGNYEFM